MKNIYLDYAATSPIKKEVYEAMKPYLTEKFGNPSSIHQAGREARTAIDKARNIVADFINAEASEIIFTSGGTEADNLALRGILNFKFKILNSEKPHIITTQIEHHAIINTCKALEKEGLAEVTYLKPNRAGIIKVEQVKAAIKANTILISIMYVNNEVGTVQPIREIGKILEKNNESRIKNHGAKIYFHTDAVQATQYQKMDVDYLHVDLLTISGHKIGAPKGIGALYIKNGTPMGKILFGGEQELNKRAGTENVAGIVSIAAAIAELRSKKQVSRIKNTEELRNYFIENIEKEIPQAELNGDRALRSPNNVNFYFRGIEGESILLNLDLVGIAASSGSACTSQSLEPSHVLMAIFDNPERAHGSIRFTLGEATSKADIDYTVSELKKIVKKLRAMSPLWIPSKVHPVRDS